MSTTSNSRADTIVLLLAVLLLSLVPGCASTIAPDAPLPVAPDAPRPAIAETSPRPPSAEPDYTRLELAAVRVRPIDAELSRLVSLEVLRTWPNPVAIEATTTTELPSTIGASSPVLIINGEVYPDTWQVRPNRLIAFVPDRGTLRDRNQVQTMWIGGGSESRSREAMTLSVPQP